MILGEKSKLHFYVYCIAVFFGISSFASERKILDVARLRIQPMSKSTSGEEVPMSYPALCSTFLVQNTKGKTFAFTAGHCMPDSIADELEAMGETPSKVYFVFDDGLIAEPEKSESIQEGIVSEIEMNRLQSPMGIDIGFFQTQQNEFESRPLPIASSHLQFGDSATIVGYPGGFGPYEFKCKYVGVGLRSEGGWASMVALDELQCPEIGARDDDIGGMSGGVVFNDKREVVGVIVQQIQSQVNDGSELSLDKMSRVGFLPLSLENFDFENSKYSPPRFTGHYRSQYLDWTTGGLVWVDFNMKDGELDGQTQIIDTEGTVLETWEFTKGSLF
ncbi:MAG: trypsin-like peptidase domain-containing protein [Bdellovibrionales bacterium]|nr:trypsin-like peptidase domain-containing protein [Bdellovibrionales bacterium]